MSISIIQNVRNSPLGLIIVYYVNFEQPLVMISYSMWSCRPVSLLKSQHKPSPIETIALWCSRICGQRRPPSGVGIKLYEVRSISPSSFCVFGFSNSCVILCIKQRQRAKINLSGITKGGSQVVGTFGVFCVVPVVLTEGIVFTKWRDTSTTVHYSNKGIRPMWGIPSSLLSF